MSASKYLSILGRQPELGLVELESVLGSGMVIPFGSHALLGATPDIDRLGGSIKIGRIIARLPGSRLSGIDLDLALLPVRDRKVTFGVSAYGLKLGPRELEAFGLGLKKGLRETGSVRYVAPKAHNELSAAQLKFNGLPDHGFELLLVSDGSEIVVALTEQFQDIDAYAARDYGRPSRDAKVGMLPPKLAQILVNLTHASMVCDPFCGTGVIPQEALLSGRSVAASDFSPEMVAATEANLAWLAQHQELPAWSVTLADARNLELPAGPVSIVSEGYLGPNQTTAPTRERVAELIPPLLELYRKVLANFARQLEPGSEVALSAPAWWVEGAWLPLPIVDEANRLGYTVKVFETVPHGPLIYGRSGQHVGRALLLLNKV